MVMEWIIELGLSKRRKSDRDDSMVKIGHLVDQLLSLIAENTLEGERGNGSVLRSPMYQIRGRIAGVSGSDIPRSIAEESLELCQNLFKQVQIRGLERVEKFTEVIEVLREALANVAGSSKAFNTRLLSSSDRLNRLAGIGEIQELKRRITGEVQELKRVVLEKQKQDEIQSSQLSQRISILQKRLDEANAEASLDGLMHVANRRSFDLAIQHWIEDHEKSEEPFTLALFDLDNFKRVNDTFGHQIGDQVLVFVAQVLSQSIRAGDFLARYGGEELVVLFNGMRLQTAEARVPELLQQIAASRIECKKADETTIVSITVSCGAAEYALGEKSEDLIHRADEALYEAKRQGRNRIATKRRPLLSAFYEGRKRNPQPDFPAAASKA